MRRLHLPFILALAAAFLADAAAAPARALPGTISVGLASGRSSLSLRLPAGSAVDGPGGRLMQVEAETALVLTKTGGHITAGGADLGPGPLCVTPGEGFLYYGTRPYRGVFRIQAAGGGLTLIDEVGFEDYLRGVVPAEVDPAWPAEALKAQAVAARTYAAGRHGSHAREGYDICATVHCQVYGGAAVEAASTNRALDETRGEILTYQGRLISAYYHSASGGYTEDVESVWAGATPFAYLRGVPDPAESSPYGRWRTELSWEEVEKAVAAKYPALGRIQEIRAEGRTQAGRVRIVVLAGERGTARISGENFRALFSLGNAKIRSTCFELRTEYAPAPAAPAEALGASQVLHTLAPSAGFLWLGVMDGGWVMIPVRLTVEGRGSGHGVGLSQWGAKALAELGYTYGMILKHYYQGVEIENWLAPAEDPAPAGVSSQG